MENFTEWKWQGRQLQGPILPQQHQNIRWKILASRKNETCQNSEKHSKFYSHCEHWINKKATSKWCKAWCYFCLPLLHPLPSLGVLRWQPACPVWDPGPWPGRDRANLIGKELSLCVGTYLGLTWRAGSARSSLFLLIQSSARKKQQECLKNTVQRVNNLQLPREKVTVETQLKGWKESWKGSFFSFKSPV